MDPRDRGIDVGPAPGVGWERFRACRRSRAPVAGRKRPGQRSRHRSPGPRRRRIVARPVACGRADPEADARLRRVRIRASRVGGDPAGRSPRARLGAAGHDGRIHGYRRARAVHLGAARPCAAGVAPVRRVHRAQPNRTSGVHACRRQPRERSGVGFDRRGRRHRATLGARRARGSFGHRALPTVGVDVEGAQVRVDPTGIGQIGELVDGVAARLWTFHPGIGPDLRHLTTFAAYTATST